VAQTHGAKQLVEQDMLKKQWAIEIESDKEADR
jgi:hypothetical protein